MVNQLEFCICTNSCNLKHANCVHHVILLWQNCFDVCLTKVPAKQFMPYLVPARTGLALDFVNFPAAQIFSTKGGVLENGHFSTSWSKTRFLSGNTKAFIWHLNAFYHCDWQGLVKWCPATSCWERNVPCSWVVWPILRKYHFISNTFQKRGEDDKC